MTVPLYQTQRNEAMLARIHEQLDDASFPEAWERGKRLSLSEAIERALHDERKVSDRDKATSTPEN